MAEALGVLIVTDPIYPYDESPLIDEFMSHITGLYQFSSLVPSFFERSS